MASFGKTFDFNFRRDYQKIPYERRDYESVDEKGLSWAMSKKKRQKKNSGDKGLNMNHLALKKFFKGFTLLNTLLNFIM